MATTRSAPDRDGATDAVVRARLVAGDTRGARHCARHELDRACEALRRKDPALAERWDAALAGWLTQTASAVGAQQPPKPPGYQGGRPSTADLLAIFETAFR